MAEAVVAQEVLRYRGTTETVEDKLVVEEPIEIRLSDVPLAVVMRTPGDDADLVLERRSLLLQLSDLGSVARAPP